MCVALINDKECFRLVLRAKSDFFIHNLPSSENIFMALKSLCKCKPIWISDMLPHNYIYKPLLFDLAEVNNDDEYKVLKRIKQSQYVYKDLWNKENGDRWLIKNILNGEIVIDGEYIRPAFSKKTSVIYREIYPEFVNPIVYHVEQNTMFDIYIGSDWDTKYEICKSGIIKLTGNEFEIISEEILKPCSGQLLVLQTDGKVSDSYRISKNSHSVFRVRYDIKRNTQYFKAGSVLDNRDCVATNEKVDLYPYVIFMEE